MSKVLSGFVGVFLVLASSLAWAESLPEKLQQLSVTIKAGGAQGSGFFLTRKMKDGDKDVDVNFVVSAAHVVSDLRSVREILDNGVTKKIVEFKDCEVVQEVSEGGRRVGEYKMNAKIIKYSHSEYGEDLVLMLVRKRGLTSANTKFYLDGDKTAVVGTELYHSASPLGQIGAGTVTSGTVTQIGRTLDLSNGEQTVFDQVNVASWPGCSGGGVFLKSDARLVGVLVRGAGESFGLIVPVRRMYSYYEKNNMLWVLDESIKMPTMKELEAIPIE